MLNLLLVLPKNKPTSKKIVLCGLKKKYFVKLQDLAENYQLHLYHPASLKIVFYILTLYLHYPTH